MIRKEIRNVFITDDGEVFYSFADAHKHEIFIGVRNWVKDYVALGLSDQYTVSDAIMDHRVELLEILGGQSGAIKACIDK